MYRRVVLRVKISWTADGIPLKQTNNDYSYLPVCQYTLDVELLCFMNINHRKFTKAPLLLV